MPLLCMFWAFCSRKIPMLSAKPYFSDFNFFFSFFFWGAKKNWLSPWYLHLSDPVKHLLAKFIWLSCQPVVSHRAHFRFRIEWFRCQTKKEKKANSENSLKSKHTVLIPYKLSQRQRDEQARHHVKRCTTNAERKTTGKKSKQWHRKWIYCLTVQSI